MIYDKLSNIDRYLGIDPNLDLAIEHAKQHHGDHQSETDTKEVAPEVKAVPVDGPVEHADIKGTDVFMNTFTYETMADDGLFEAHQQYADLFVMRSGQERVEIAHTTSLRLADARPDQDIWILEGTAELSIVFSPGYFMIVFPEEGHKLKLMLESPQVVTRAVYKARFASH